MIRYQTTLDCGCKIQDYGKGDMRMKHCPKHAAVDALLKICSSLVSWEENRALGLPANQHLVEIIDAAKAAIAPATKEREG